MKRFYLLLLIFLTQLATVAVGQVHLLKNLVQPNENSPTAGSYPFNFYTQNGKLFFTATTKAIGLAFYVSDGTAEGTSLLLDVGDFENSDWSYAPIGDKTIFLRSIMAGTSAQIWVTDGTAAGTRKLKDLTGNCNVVGSANGVAVVSSFSANTTQLWRTDGTVEGTGLLVDLGERRVYDRQPAMNSTGSLLYFSADKNYNDTELWKTDGSPEGTSMIAPYSSHIKSVKVEGNEFYFSPQPDQLFHTDGTQAGIEQVPMIFPGNVDNQGIDFSRTVSFDGKMVGVAWVNDLNQYYIWDGLPSGNITYLDINTAGHSARSINDSSVPVSFKGNAYFIADDGVNGFKLWKSDGTVAGTAAVTGMGLPNSYARAIYASDDKIWVVCGGNTQAGSLLVETWASDGTTPFVKVFKSAYVYPATIVNDDLYFGSDDGIHGGELFKSDGTTNGTGLVADVEKATSLAPLWLLGGDDKLFFSTRTQAGGINIGTSDGTTDGTSVVKEFNDFIPTIYFPAATHDSRIIFTGNDANHGNEPWITDGTAAGTFMLADTEPGSETSYTNLATQYKWAGDKAFFFSSAGELWVTDGTPEGSSPLKQFDDPLEVNTFSLGFKGSYYFLYKDFLWKSDGTSVGTIKLKQIAPPGASTPFITGMLGGTNKFYFMIDDGTHGLELWVSDGTEAGTHMTKDIHTSGSSFSFFYPIAVINDIAYYGTGANDNDDLWRSDGTEEGTYIVKDINMSGPSLVKPIEQYNAATVVDGNIFYFSADDGVHGSELWKSDGTEAGTVMVKDINPGIGSSYPAYSTEKAINGKIVFFAYDGIHGIEPWRSDGTAERTVMLQDLNPGTGSSLRNGVSGSLMTTFNDKVFFIAYAPAFETPQIWWHDPSAQISQTVYLDNIPGKKFLDPSFTISATSSSGLPVTYAIVSGPATISGSTITITGAGDVHVKATQQGNDDFEPAFAEQTFTVAKADQVITFNTIPVKKSNDVPFSLTASSTSGLAITFSVTSGPATISGNTLTITGAGTVVVKATQAGNVNYNAAMKEQSFDIELFVGLEDETAGVNIFPNPATNTLVVSAALFKTITIKDIVGRDVITINISSENTTLDVTHLPRGMYVVRLMGENQKAITRKIILN